MGLFVQPWSEQLKALKQRRERESLEAHSAMNAIRTLQNFPDNKCDHGMKIVVGRHVMECDECTQDARNQGLVK